MLLKLEKEAVRGGKKKIQNMVFLSSESLRQACNSI